MASLQGHSSHFDSAPEIPSFDRFPLSKVWAWELREGEAGRFALGHPKFPAYHFLPPSRNMETLTVGQDPG